MDNRILIVDDDDDFRSLLSDLYTQAEYQVVAVSNPLDALQKLEEEPFSLCVTDQSMPELQGVEFIERSRVIKPNLPIIMVSAYLSDQLTRRLQSMRIEVFHKPLNIMSLLRKTADLIKMASTPIETPMSPSEAFSNEDSEVDEEIHLDDFQSFALQSDASKRLKKEIEGIGVNLPNLVLVGDEGTYFHSICKDVERQVNSDEHLFLYFSNRKLNVFDISKMIAGQPTSKNLVFVLTEAYDLGVAHKQALLKLYKKSGPFAGVQNPVKFIFCLHEDLDTLFVKGAIDEDFYLILGQKEIYVPRLNLFKEDIPYLADQVAKELVDSEAVNTKYAGFEPDTTELFYKTDWVKNYESLKSVVVSSLRLAGGKKISKTLLTQAIDNPSNVENLEDVDQSVSNDGLNQEVSEEKAVQMPDQVEKSRASIPLVDSGDSPAKIESFPMLENERELALSIFLKI